MHKIDERYNLYKLEPESHPQYTEEWNEYWLLNFYKVKGHNDAFKTELLREPWRDHWEKLVVQLHDEELLKLKVNLRKKLNLPAEISDLQKYDSITMSQKVKIKEKNPTVPIVENDITAIENCGSSKVKIPISPKTPLKPLIDLRELAFDVNIKNKELNPPTLNKLVANPNLNSPDSTTKLAEPESSLKLTEPENNEVTSNVVKENSDETKKPNVMETLSNKDLIVLFGNYDHLSEYLKLDLITFMKSLEETDPERYQDLTKTSIDNNDDDTIEDKASETLFNKEISDAVQSLPDVVTVNEKVAVNNEDDDDYSLDDSEMIRCAKEKAEAIEISDTDDSSKDLVIDLTDE